MHTQVLPFLREGDVGPGHVAEVLNALRGRFGPYVREVWGWSVGEIRVFLTDREVTFQWPTSARNLPEIFRGAWSGRGVPVGLLGPVVMGCWGPL